jgi:hypothetical protein
MKHTHYPVLLALVLVILLSSCGSEARENGRAAGAGDEVPQYSFNVDPERIGEKYGDRELGLRLAPPEGWVQAPESLKEQVRSQVTENTDITAEEMGLRTLFVDRSSGSALIVYDPFERDDPGAVFDEWVGPDDETAEFRHNGLHFYQARRVTEAEVRFTLVVEAQDGVVTVLQYFMPQAHFKEIGRSVESSIGSIEPLEGAEG